MIKKVVIKTTPNLGAMIEPYLEILDGTNFDVIWTNNPKFKDQNKYRKPIYIKGPMEITKSKPGESDMSIDIYSDQGEVELSGDLFCRIYNNKSKKLICRFAFNTSFMDMQGQYTDKMRMYKLGKKAIDPDSIQKSNDYSPDFGIEIHYLNACNICSPESPLSSLCAECVKKT